MAHGAPDWWIQGIIPMRYINLSDTSGDFIDRAGLVPEVNAAEELLIWSEAKIDDHSSRHESGGADEPSLAGMTPGDHAGRHASGGADEVDITGLTPPNHEARHRNGGLDVLLHNNMALNNDDHHAPFLAADARAAIDDIFGADGKADKDIDLDTHTLLTGLAEFGPVNSATVTIFTQNAYWDDPNWRYRTNGFAILTVMDRDIGDIKIYQGPDGVADAVIAFVLTFRIDAAGDIVTAGSILGWSPTAPVMLDCHAFKPERTAAAYQCHLTAMFNQSALTAIEYYADARLTHGLTVARMDLWAFRNLGANITCRLYRQNLQGTSNLMATITAGWTDGWNTGFDDSIDDAVVDNNNYGYYVEVKLDPAATVTTAMLSGVRLTYA